MAPLFPSWTNTVARLMAGLLLASPLVLVAALMGWQRTPFITGESQPVAQPVQFDHRHHTQDEGIDCRYCHFSVEKAASAGMPSVSLCMNCHSQVWNASPLLEPIRRAYFEDRPIPWARVNDLPDFVYFNHSIHVAKGVGCVTCHGRVDLMPAVMQARPLTMSWCLECHRNPAPNLRPPSEVTNMAEELSGTWAAADVHPRTNCSACHR